MWEIRIADSTKRASPSGNLWAERKPQPGGVGKGRVELGFGGGGTVRAHQGASKVQRTALGVPSPLKSAPGAVKGRN